MQVLVSPEIFRKITFIEGGPQYIVRNNHPGHYMNISELELPPDLYAEETEPGGDEGKLIAPDKLVSWADQGRGDAIFRLCHTIHERELANINAWESERIRQLEDELMAVGNDEDMSARKYANVRHYHTTLEDVAREAELKRARVNERMIKHQAALEDLVKEAREFISAYAAQQDESDMLTHMLVIVAAAAIAYSLFF